MNMNNKEWWEKWWGVSLIILVICAGLILIGVVNNIVKNNVEKNKIDAEISSVENPEIIGQYTALLYVEVSNHRKTVLSPELILKISDESNQEICSGRSDYSNNWNQIYPNSSQKISITIIGAVNSLCKIEENKNYTVTIKLYDSKDENAKELDTKILYMEIGEGEYNQWRRIK